MKKKGKIVFLKKLFRREGVDSGNLAYAGGGGGPVGLKGKELGSIRSLNIRLHGGTHSPGSWSATE